MTLSTLKPGERAVIESFATAAEASLSSRLMEMGLTVGSEVSVEHAAPFGGPIAVRCRGSLIALRLSEAQAVKVRSQ